MFSQVMETFAVAAGRVLENWTALTFAVEHGTAGNPRESAERKFRLLDEVIAQCCARPGNAPQLSQVLLDRLGEEFNITLEDGSEQEVSRILVELHRRIVMLGDLSAVNLIQEIRHQKQNQFPEGKDDSDSSYDSGDSWEESGDESMEISSPKKKPQPDADGWTVFKKN